jgi:hypothetical protein
MTPLITIARVGEACDISVLFSAATSGKLHFKDHPRINGGL